MSYRNQSVAQLEELLATRLYQLARACYSEHEIKHLLETGTSIQDLCIRCSLDTSTLEVELDRRRSGLADLERRFMGPDAEKPESLD